jgi:hypothetical protein
VWLEIRVLDQFHFGAHYNTRRELQRAFAVKSIEGEFIDLCAVERLQLRLLQRSLISFGHDLVADALRDGFVAYLTTHNGRGHMTRTEARHSQAAREVFDNTFARMLYDIG